jgi:hypothetical protein
MIMKTLYLSLIVFCFLAGRALAADGTGMNTWGPAVRGVQILLNVKRHANDVESNEPPIVTVTISNSSPSDVHLSVPNLRPAIWFHVTSPSGADFSTKEPLSRDGSQIVPPVVGPGKTMTIDFQLTDICRGSDVGMYRFTSKARIFDSVTNYVVTSNPLSIALSRQDLDNAPKKPRGF